MHKELRCTYDEALTRVTEALKTEGFGVLTEIDVKETLKKKIDVDFRRYKILGACNPPFAHRALQTDLQAGLLMPCNVVVYENDEQRATVMAVDPMQTIAMAGKPELTELATEVRAKLERALGRLE
ncbi:MAG: DUF302 domain-containing protein [Deltaproteobacteria bacterium]|nr:DUF302 domain-containing protein [Deltaproteobacteria bacterium]